jgi:hypothetical protein
MSYCRWSSMDFGCDLYVYDSVQGGIAIDVAAIRIVGDIPKVTSEMTADIAGPYWIERKAQHEFLGKATRVPIELPYAGESFSLSPGDAIAKLRELKALGYVFPGYVIEDIAADAAEGIKNALAD